MIDFHNNKREICTFPMFGEGLASDKFLLKNKEEWANWIKIHVHWMEKMFRT